MRIYSFYKVFILSFLIIICFGTILQIYELREKILTKVDNFFGNDFAAPGNAGHAYWAKEILKGGYILHFRHAEREKWIDVQMYDALASDLHDNGNNHTSKAENDYFYHAVCLSSRGLTQVKAMAEVVQYSGLPYDIVISSPICRARQTAEFVFGGYNYLERILVHKGPYSEEEANRVKYLKKLYVSLRPIKGMNTIISAHNSVVHKDMFVNFHFVFVL